jgi:hypothetical protein
MHISRIFDNFSKSIVQDPIPFRLKGFSDSFRASYQIKKHWRSFPGIYYKPQESIQLALHIEADLLSYKFIFIFMAFYLLDEKCLLQEAAIQNS